MEYEVIKNGAKTAAGFVAPVLDLKTAKAIIKEFGFSTNKLVLKNYAGKQYVIFKGYPGQRSVFTGTRYVASNPKVVRMALSPKGILNSAKGGFVISAVLSVTINIFDFFIQYYLTEKGYSRCKDPASVSSITSRGESYIYKLNGCGA